MEETFSFVDAPCLLEGLDEKSPRLLIVTMNDQGRFRLEGSREAVNDFLEACARSGLIIELDRLAWCG